jgi:hypothetical protein
MTWDEYVQFLSAWAGSTRFEATVFRITEVGRTVFQEIEERHYRGEDFIRKNVLAVYGFDAADKIRHLDIYEQAKDSGQWIIEAAEKAMAGKRPSPACGRRIPQLAAPAVSEGWMRGWRFVKARPSGPSPNSG